MTMQFQHTHMTVPAAKAQARNQLPHLAIRYEDSLMHDESTQWLRTLRVHL